MHLSARAVLTVLRKIQLDYPDTLLSFFRVSGQGSSAVGTWVSLDCSLPESSLSVAVQKTLFNVSLPLIFIILAVPTWFAIWYFKGRKGDASQGSHRGAKTEEKGGASGEQGGDKDTDGVQEVTLGEVGPESEGEKAAAQRRLGGNSKAAAAVAETVEDAQEGESKSPSRPGGELRAGQADAAEEGGAQQDGRLSASEPEGTAFKPYLQLRLLITTISILFFMVRLYARSTVHPQYHETAVHGSVLQGCTELHSTGRRSGSCRDNECTMPSM